MNGAINKDYQSAFLFGKTLLCVIVYFAMLAAGLSQSILV